MGTITRVLVESLAKFLVDAKKNCYAGDGKKQIAEDGSKILTFQKGDFHYTDNYSGWYQAPGSEIVRWKNEEGRRIWMMSYSGGMLEEFIGDEALTKNTFEFLKKALKAVNKDSPFRGPKEFREENFRYFNIVKGDMMRFKGNESILAGLDGNSGYTGVFSQDYIGGLVIPK